MYEFSLCTIILACVLGGFLLQRFDNDVTPYGWLISTAMGGMVSTLMMLLPSAQKGSPLALVSGYLLIGVLVLSALVLFGLSRLPSKLVAFNSPDIERMGKVLLSLLGAGLSVFLKNAFILIAALSGAIIKLLLNLMVLLMTLVDGSARRGPYLLRP